MFTSDSMSNSLINLDSYSGPCNIVHTDNCYSCHNGWNREIEYIDCSTSNLRHLYIHRNLLNMPLGYNYDNCLNMENRYTHDNSWLPLNSDIRIAGKIALPD